MSIKRLVMPIFESSVHLITTKDEAKAFIQEHSETPEDYTEWENFSGFAHEITDAQGTTRHILCVFDGSLNTVIHEATHMAQQKMMHLNLRMKRRGDEVLAYFTAYLSEEMLNLIKQDKEAA